MELAKLKVALEAEKEVILNFEEYLKLFRFTPVIFSNVRYMKVMDKLLRFFFSTLQFIQVITHLLRGQRLPTI
mgnify:CR=1 FL=1